MAAQRTRATGGAASGEADELIGLIDRLERILAGSELSELEVEVGATGLLLRKPSALVAASANGALALGPSGGRAQPEPETAGTTPVPGATPGEAVSPYHLVLAPLTGIFYSAPSPDAAPYVRVGGEVNVGQVIGLIEAMKLFNEIKSDVRGRVIRLTAENGALIKARQPLIEVDPT